MQSTTVATETFPSHYRITKQRAAVLRALGSGSHLSAETILERVRNEIPGVSLGTIYRTLDILRENGLVQIFSFGGNAARYEAAHGKHYHLMCSSCRELTDVRRDDIDPLAHAIACDAGFTEVEVALTITGRCLSCAAR
ncbi:MAG: transcriptional repressor [Vulcanimicrobiaceae bacterium]